MYRPARLLHLESLYKAIPLHYNEIQGPLNQYVRILQRVNNIILPKTSCALKSGTVFTLFIIYLNACFAFLKSQMPRDILAKQSKHDFLNGSRMS